MDFTAFVDRLYFQYMQINLIRTVLASAAAASAGFYCCYCWRAMNVEKKPFEYIEYDRENSNNHHPLDVSKHLFYIWICISTTKNQIKFQKYQSIHWFVRWKKHTCDDCFSELRQPSSICPFYIFILYT